MSVSDNEKDEFWSLDKLVPKKKVFATPFRTVNETVTHEIKGEESGKNPDGKLTFEGMKGVNSAEDISYERSDAALVKKVTIKRFIDKYDFYGNFRKAALIYHDYKTPKCDFVPYYSYMPQYSQLTATQKNYYFFWRSEVRRGKFIKCDYSYLYLYVYEILNLPDEIPPKEGVKILVTLWREYRAALPRIDAYFAAWLQDYCLVYNLPLPMESISDFIFEVIAASSFKEFYLSDIRLAGEGGADAMIAYLSDYDPNKSKYADENRETFKRHMRAAVRLLLLRLFEERDFSSAERAVLRRDAFPHSLCTHAVKCKLEIEYIPLSTDKNMRNTVTLGVRYTENKLRALFGIRSRLAVKDFPDEYKRLIDSYFAGLFEDERIRRERENMPEYEKLYDAVSEEVSFEGADEIERASWSTTLRLVDTDEIEDTTPVEDERSDGEPSEEAEPEQQLADRAEPTTDTYGLSMEDISLLALALNDGYFKDEERVERINEAFSDGYGDIILESDGEKYVIIEDYKEELSEWLSKVMK